MKYTNRHGLIWWRVDRIQTAPDMNKRVVPEPKKDPRDDSAFSEASRSDYYLKNSFRS